MPPLCRCDTRFFTDNRPAFVADNRRVLRALDLAAFNVLDLDSYGSPWEQAYIIARRRKLRPGERLGMVPTDGTLTWSKLKRSVAVAMLAGTYTHIVGLPRTLDNIIDRSLLGRHHDRGHDLTALAGHGLLWPPHDVHRLGDRQAGRRLE